MKAHAIIQARFGATRLPGKMLLRALGKTMLEYVVERTRRASSLAGVIVATTVSADDLPLVQLASGLGVGVYCGSENDVLDRYYQAARLFGAEHVVRITADSPLIDHRVIDRVVGEYFRSGADYCANTIGATFPDGEDVEVFSFSALSDSWKHANLVSEREHVTPYIKKHPGTYKLVDVSYPVNLVDKRWTLDEREDYEFIRAVIEELYPRDPDFSMSDILDLVRRKPHLEEINKGIVRNEGYQRSLANDAVIKR